MSIISQKAYFPPLCLNQVTFQMKVCSAIRELAHKRGRRLGGLT